MELRKVEQELEVLSSEWKTLRRKQPKFDDDTSIGDSNNEALCKIMPSWKDLKAKVNDDELFPQYEDNENDDDMIEDDVVDSVNQDESGKDTNNNTEDVPTLNAEDTGGYSEFGMLLPSNGNEEESENKDNTESSSTNGGSIFERYAAKNTVAAKSTVNAPQKQTTSTSTEDESSDEEDELVEDASPKDVLARLESFQGRFHALEPKIDKFKAKLRDRDPVTKKPRYGEKTLPRVMNLIRKYKALEDGVEIVFRDNAATGSTCLVSSLRIQVQQHTEQVNEKIQARRSKEQLEKERIAKEKKLAEEEADKQRLLKEQKKREEEQELARRAEEARVRRLEEEQRVLDAERQEDEELLALVPTLGVDGVREQINRMREALKDDKVALDVALGSLYTLFEQIVRKPEEINFRRVRRDHPKFTEDIGRHVGGREVLIAAGFTLEKLDGVPCFFSKEPHIESDMDGWSDWFDTLKKTLTVIEEEMMK